MNLSNYKTRRKRTLAVSAVLGMVIGLGITAAVGAGVYYTYQEQADLFSTSAQIEVRNLNAIRSGDTLTITANVKNVGSTALTDVYLANIGAGGEFSITTDNPNDNIEIRSGTHTAFTEVNTSYDGGGDLCDGPLAGADCDPADEGTLEVSGVSYSSPDGGASLDGGGTNAIRLTVTMDGLTPPDNNISNTVTISDRLTLQLGFTSGDDEFLSDVYNTRVRPG